MFSSDHCLTTLISQEKDRLIKKGFPICWWVDVSGHFTGVTGILNSLHRFIIIVGKNVKAKAKFLWLLFRLYTVHFEVFYNHYPANEDIIFYPYLMFFHSL